ncbi:endonuclease/exonuclease/phosphatase family protein [Rubellicoccus peritrichatus]|uniref:Endonuclease/exonuclease/phosphatase family protein n=1 Tax=Rubellicoccus peritrichatus TaxID=3080537 RepID=A0AAQ3L7J6_9BACT|nr:endonuclease/exonuclease/phosphatase family protein [Puniceicoccus sp. CR14]WOO41069.1 endonuclease/exonuclease/phosphatase family protein [Puniceicoccus sp. CR14]
MKYEFKVLIFCLLTTAFSLPSIHGETIRVASFNVRNYLNTDRWVEGRWRQDYPKPEEEKQALREIIRRVSPDVLAIQEMGGAEFLSEFQSDLKAEGLDYPFAELLKGPDEDRHLAIFSKVSPVRIKSHDQVLFRYFEEQIPIKRGIQEIVFETNNIRWSLFNVHLKSRWTDRKDDPESQKRRVGEAQAARDLIRTLHPPGEVDSRYIVAGDFNDAKDSSTVKRFLKVSDTKLTEMVPCYDSRGENWTFHYRRKDIYQRVDFILVSPLMESLVRGASGTIVDLLPESKVASDHRMLYIDLDFPD